MRQENFFIQVVYSICDIDITMADLQAVLWYNENNLYRQFGYTARGSQPADYEDAAKLLLNQYKKSVEIGEFPDRGPDIAPDPSEWDDQRLFDIMNGELYDGIETTTRIEVPFAFDEEGEATRAKAAWKPAVRSKHT